MRFADGQGREVRTGERIGPSVMVNRDRASWAKVGGQGQDPGQPPGVTGARERSGHGCPAFTEPTHHTRRENVGSVIFAKGPELPFRDLVLHRGANVLFRLRRFKLIIEIALLTLELRRNAFPPALISQRRRSARRPG